MDPGRLDRLITLRTTGMIDDGYGGQIPGGTVDMAMVWASVRQTSGGEFVRFNQVVSERRTVFTLHWRGDVTTAETVRWDNTDWNIREVRDLGRGKGLELHCTSVP